jgi:hypothetical protein
MGMLAGSIVSGSMLAIMMSNAGGAWDNSKKLCEKLQIKKSEQGKSCIIGDTVGDPFKDTSGPALNILIKLMSMVSLLIAPLIKGKETWDDWYLGMIPLALFIILSLVLVYKGILTWKDPLAELQAKGSSADATVGDEKKSVEQGDVKSDAAPEEVGPVLMQSSMDARPMDEKPEQEVDVKKEGTEEKPLQQDAENECVAEV